MDLTVFDVIAVAVVGVFALLGLRKGLISEVFKILGIVVGITLALQYINPMAKIIHSFAATTEQVEKVIAFILILVFTMVVFIYLARVAKLVFKVALMGWLDKGGGLLFGGLKGALILSAFLPLFAFLPDKIDFIKETKKKSTAYKYLQGFAPAVYDTIAKTIPGADNFASKIKNAFPAAGSFDKLSKGEVDPDQLNVMQNFMGSDESALLKELQKNLGDDVEIQDMRMKDIDLNSSDRKKLDKMLKDYKKKDQRKKKR